MYEPKSHLNECERGDMRVQGSDCESARHVAIDF